MKSAIADNAVTVEIACSHCSEPCTDSTFSYADEIFCCGGCKSVYLLLKEHNLCDFYSVGDDRIHTLKNVSATSLQRFEYLDDCNVVADITAFQNSEITTVEFILPQIHCASCVWILEKLPIIQNGILKSEIHFPRKTISIAFQQNIITLRQVVELLTKLGYEPTILRNSGNENNYRNPNRDLYSKIGVAGFALMNIMIFSLPEYFDSQTVANTGFSSIFRFANALLATIVLVYSSRDYFRNSIISLQNKSVSIELPIAIGISALYLRSIIEVAFNSGTGFFDSFAGLVFLLLLGQLLQRKTFDSLVFDRNHESYFPLSALKVFSDGAQRYIPVDSLCEDDIIIVKNQEIIPADSIVAANSGYIDYSFVTGESTPIEVLDSELAYSGGKVVGKALKMIVHKKASRRYLTQLWNNDLFKKNKKRLFASVSNVFGAYFTVFILLLSGITAWVWLPDISMAINASTAVLIIACPCAVYLAAPFALNTAMKGLGQSGLYVKSTDVIVDLSTIDTIVFDKTGTLSDTKKSSIKYSGDELKPDEIAAVNAMCKQSTHPLAFGIAEYLKHSVYGEPLSFEEISGRGMKAGFSDMSILMGSYRFIAEELFEHNLAEGVESPYSSGICIAINGVRRGNFHVVQNLREKIGSMLISLTKKGFSLFLFSGDSSKEFDFYSKYFQPNAMKFLATPIEKMQETERLKQKGKRVLMVGDGLNDEGALSSADVGIAVSESSGSFTPSSDALISAESMYRIPELLQYARRTKLSIIIAFGISIVYNIIGLTLAIQGILTPLTTAVFMPLSSLSLVVFVVGFLSIAAPAKKGK